MKKLIRVSSVSLLPILFGALSVGCIGEEPSLSSSEDAVTTSNKLASNKLASNKLASNKLASNKLASNSLASQGLMSTADGRDVVSYIVGCALPTGQSATLIDSSGTSYTFPGWIGLAPAWATRAPTVSERRWVTACLLARTNLYATAVNISMRNDSNVTLFANTAETTTYNEAEGAFYGDLFATTPTEFACASKAFSVTADAGVEALRACSRPATGGVTTQCGFTFTGYCGSTYPGKTIPCTDKTEPYGTCAGSGTQYAEVITIFLPKP